jgi:sterol desaturase/sphingolipid hydroxylase (fatty acid hydroxylase superfamily)
MDRPGRVASAPAPVSVSEQLQPGRPEGSGRPGRAGLPGRRHHDRLPGDRPRLTRRRRTATSYLLHGMVVAGAVGAVAVDRWARRRFGSAIPLGALTASVTAYGALWAVEQCQPARDEWRPSAPEVATDAAFLGSVVATQIVATATIAPIGRRVTANLGVHRLPLPVGVGIAVLAYDLVHSRLHHLSHRWGPAWRLHAVHHSPERLYWFNATRFHGLEMFIDMAVETLVMALLGLSRDQHVAYQAVRSMYGQLQHCNIDLRSGALNHVFSTPDLHRWHHSTVYAEGDTNFGAVTSVWDRVFGTYLLPGDREVPDALGIGQMPEFPQRFWELERVPIDWTAIAKANTSTRGDTDDDGQASPAPGGASSHLVH